jgi:hypothetical protein
MHAQQARRTLRMLSRWLGPRPVPAMRLQCSRLLAKGAWLLCFLGRDLAVCCRAFEIFEAYGLLLAQPSLCPTEHVSRSEARACTHSLQKPGQHMHLSSNATPFLTSEPHHSPPPPPLAAAYLLHHPQSISGAGGARAAICHLYRGGTGPQWEGRGGRINNLLTHALSIAACMLSVPVPFSLSTTGTPLTSLLTEPHADNGPHVRHGHVFQPHPPLPPQCIHRWGMHDVGRDARCR